MPDSIFLYVRLAIHCLNARIAKTSAYVAIFLMISASTFTANAQPEGTLVVFAASSLTNAFVELGEVFEAEYPGTEIIFEFAGSSTLALQIAEGAPADVFASADENQMMIVQGAGRVEDKVEIFALNRLILAVPIDNPAHIESHEDLRNDHILLVMAAGSVPVRQYTDLLLTRLSAEDAFGEQYRADVEANIVSEETNVRQIMAKIVLGEADAGIVYQSDITPDVADDVIAIAIDSDLSPLAQYPIAITEDSDNPALAEAFIEFVLSPVGQETLVEWGFVPLDELLMVQDDIDCDEAAEDSSLACNSDSDTCNDTSA